MDTHPVSGKSRSKTNRLDPKLSSFRKTTLYPSTLAIVVPDPHPGWSGQSCRLPSDDLHPAHVGFGRTD